MDETAAFAWLYAVGCVEARSQADMSEDDYRLATQYMEDGVIPPSEFIRENFPKPFVHADTLEDMQRYWRKDHSGPDE